MIERVELKDDATVAKLPNGRLIGFEYLESRRSVATLTVEHTYVSPDTVFLCFAYGDVDGELLKDLQVELAEVVDDLFTLAGMARIDTMAQPGCSYAHMLTALGFEQWPDPPVKVGGKWFCSYRKLKTGIS